MLMLLKAKLPKWQAQLLLIEAANAVAMIEQRYRKGSAA
jgi:hypothetical protein